MLLKAAKMAGISLEEIKNETVDLVFLSYFLSLPFFSANFDICIKFLMFTKIEFCLRKMKSISSNFSKLWA